MIRQYISATLNQYRTKRFNSLPVRFIVSTGRTGTRFFESFFNDNFPDVLCLHQPSPDGFDVGIGKIRGKLDTEEVERYLRSSRGRIFSMLSKRKAKLYVESNPYFSLVIPELRAAFPKSRFVWIVRDPKAYVVSAYNKSPVGDNKMFFYAENDHRARLAATDFPDDPWSKAWLGFGRFEKICWYWNKCNEILARDLDDANDMLLIKFEHLFAREDSCRTMVKVLEFFKIHNRDRMDMSTVASLMTRRINSSPRILLHGAETWTAKQKRDFDVLTQPMREKLGY
jgi:hypothetical protein